MNAKSNTTAAAKVEETKTAAVAPTKVLPLPIDGSKGEEYIKTQGSVSKAIRTLTAQGCTRGEVSKMLNKRYQHVRNVLVTPVKKVEEPSKAA